MLNVLILYFSTNGNVQDASFVKDRFFIFAVGLSLVLYPSKISSLRLRVGIGGLFMLSFFNQYLITSQAVILQWQTFMAGVILLPQVVHLGDRKVLGNGILLAGVIQAICLILNQWGLEPLRIYSYFLNADLYYVGAGVAVPHNVVMPIGTLMNINMSSVLCVAALPFAIRAFPLFILPLVYAVLLSKSSMSYLGALSVIFWYIYSQTRAKKKFIAASIFVLLCSLYLLKGHYLLDGGNRFKIWEIALKVLSIRPFTGMGLGFVYDNFPMYFTAQEFRQLHNEPLEFLVNFGLVGVFFLGLILSKVTLVKKNWSFFAVIFALLVNSLGNLTYHISSLSLITLLCLGILLQNNYLEEKCYV